MEMIPNIKEIVREKLDELELVPQKNLDEWIKPDGHVFFTTKCDRKDGETALFKARISTDKFFQECIKNEILTSVFLQDHEEMNKVIKFRKVYDWGLTSKLDWGVFQFMDGEEITHDHLNEEKIDMVVEILNRLQKIDALSLPLQTYFFEGIFNELKYKNIKWRENRYERYEKIFEQVTTELNFNQKDEVMKLIRDNREIIESATEVLCHGDLDLNNVLENKGVGQLIDWERVMVGNKAYDLANIYTRMSDEKWRTMLIEKFIIKQENPQEFKNLFRVMVILQCIYKIYPASQKSVNDEVEAMKEWYATIDKAIKGYDELLA